MTETLKHDIDHIARELAAKILQEAETKRIFKEALTEWLDKKFEAFGKWSARGLAAAAFVAVIVLIMWAQGYHR